MGSSFCWRCWGRVGEVRRCGWPACRPPCAPRRCRRSNHRRSLSRTGRISNAAPRRSSRIQEAASLRNSNQARLSSKTPQAVRLRPNTAVTEARRKAPRPRPSNRVRRAHKRNSRGGPDHRAAPRVQALRKRTPQTTTMVPGNKQAARIRPTLALAGPGGRRARDERRQRRQASVDRRASKRRNKPGLVRPGTAGLKALPRSSRRVQHPISGQDRLAARDSARQAIKR